jgi:multidrug efflux pump subunit AcrA (membrane-fusion protein)
VYVVKGDTIEERIVTTGEVVGSRVEITSGLAEGNVVATEPGGRLADGVAVRAR